MNWNCIVRITTQDGSISFGTGFVVKTDGHILTASHVVRASKGQVDGEGRVRTNLPIPEYTFVEIRDSSNKKQIFKAHVISEGWLEWGKGDTAVLKLPREKVEHLRLAPVYYGPRIPDLTNNKHQQHSFVTRGFPAGEGTEPKPGEGYITDQLPDSGRLQLKSTEVTRGYSGAPIYSIQMRQIIGIVSAIIPMDSYGKRADQAKGVPLHPIYEKYPAIKPPQKSPYKGLDAYHEDDSRYFYGRNSLIDEAVSKLGLDNVHLPSHPNLLAVLGDSGSGKSSLVYAGLIPEIKDLANRYNQSWLCISFKPAPDPYTALYNALFQTLRWKRDEDKSLIDNLGNLFQSNKQLNRLVLFIDQFEELLTQVEPGTARSFLQDLSLVYNSVLPITILITMRKDRLDKLQEVSIARNNLRKDLVKDVISGNKNSIDCDTEFSDEDLREIIFLPALQAGLVVEDNLVDELIRRVRLEQTHSLSALSEGHSNPVVLPILQLYLEQVWEQYLKSKTNKTTNLIAKDFLNVSDIANLLNKKAQEAINEIDDKLKSVNHLSSTDSENINHIIQPDVPFTTNLVSSLCHWILNALERIHIRNNDESTDKQSVDENSQAYNQGIHNPTVRRIFLDLTSIDPDVKEPARARTRRWLSLSKLSRNQSEKGNILRVIEVLMEKRLLMSFTVEDNTYYGVIHETILTRWPALDHSLTAFRKDIIRRQELEYSARRWKEDSDNLLGRDRLGTYRASLKRLELHPSQVSEFDDVTEFIIESERIICNQTVQLLLIFVAVSLVVILLSSSFIFQQVEQARIGRESTATALANENNRQEALEPTIEIPRANIILRDHEQRVPIDGFHIDQYEVSYRQYRLCMQVGACEPIRFSLSGTGLNFDHDSAPDNYPALNVTAVEAATFCNWVGGQLPTLEQWEYAARGTDGRTYPWGDTPPNQIDTVVNTFVDGQSIDAVPQPVAVNDSAYTSGSTPDGIMHMYGNVREWTRSPSNCDSCSPWEYGEIEPDSLQLMGRSFASNAVSSNDEQDIIFDDSANPEFSSYDIGFRCVYSVEN